jgi:hypothetical protein
MAQHETMRVWRKNSFKASVLQSQCARTLDRPPWPDQRCLPRAHYATWNGDRSLAHAGTASLRWDKRHRSHPSSAPPAEHKCNGLGKRLPAMTSTEHSFRLARHARTVVADLGKKCEDGRRLALSITVASQLVDLRQDGLNTTSHDKTRAAMG